MKRYELSDAEWKVIEPLLPRNLRGVKRVDDRRVLNGIFWRLRSGAPWADIPERYGPCTTCYNRFVRWRGAGIWDRLLVAVSQAFEGRIQIIDGSAGRGRGRVADGERKPAAAVAWTVPAAELRRKFNRFQIVADAPILLDLTSVPASDGEIGEEKT